ncbi:MAG: oligosaccharide flippase family protein [Candidatus Pacebacteria bacterium]|nr:oligosaccharide flippase family protein [Candidatus Paceibacterota bacterium]
MVYIAHGNFWGIFGQIITAFLSLALTMVFANYLPRETYGLYTYILSLAGVFSIFSLIGMNEAVSQATAAGDEGALRASVRYQLKWNMLQFGMSCIAAAYYALQDNTIVALSLLIMGICAPLTAAFNTYGAYLAGKKEFRLNTIFSIISTAVYAVSMMAIVIANGEVTWLVLVYSLSTLITTFFFYRVTLQRFNPPTQEAHDALQYGRELTFIGFLGPIVSQVDKILLTHFWGASQLAVYTLAMAIPNRASIAIKNLLGIALPKFSTKAPKELNRLFYLRIFQGLAVGSFFTIGYIILAPYVFTYLLPKYLDALYYSQLLSLIFIFGMPNRFISLLMSSQRFSRLIFISNTTQLLIRIALYVVLGIWGGILGLIIAQILIAMIGMFVNIITWRLATRAA